MVFGDIVTVFLLVFTTDVDSFDDATEDGEYEICVDVKVAVKVVVDDTVVIAASDPHITLNFPCNPPEIQKTGVNIF